MHVPELRTASRRADRAAAAQWRAERRVLRESGGQHPLQLAVITDGTDRALAHSIRASGADVIGLLAPDPLESMVWAAEAGADHGYSALDVLAADAIDAACLDLPLAEACRVAGLLLPEGVSVLMARPEIPDRAEVRALLDAASVGASSLVLGLGTRAWESLAAAVRMLPQLGALSQLTVIGWPVGRSARAELCDVVRRLCGDVIAVCGSAANMPVPELTPTDPVTLALLTATGATVVASESSRNVVESAQLTLVGGAGRAVIGQSSMRFADQAGVREIPLGGGVDPVRLAAEGLRDELEGGRSAAAGLGDVLAAARVLELAARSYEVDAWVEA